ncbi:hypothetical protein [Cryobacterium sp. Y62]|uniref:hypothetical protein n=1 Tax=Cryobacterium sp. Y62 TaxID=2048284 RepID=UPI000CE35B28|nr:hypothetical protein [Cryobacterium sp. Y62]
MAYTTSGVPIVANELDENLGAEHGDDKTQSCICRQLLFYSAATVNRTARVRGREPFFVQNP